MSYAVAKPQASSPTGADGPPSTATVYDFICLFTHDLRRKQKRWQDGKLKYHSFNKKVMVYDDRGHFVGDAHWDKDGDLAPGDELSLDRGMALVQVEDCTGEKQQDLTDLLDKRAREVEKRRQIAAAKTRPTPRSSLATGGAGQTAPQRPHLPLSSLVQSPARIGRAAIPAHSPFEARQQRLHQNQPPTTDSQPTVVAVAGKKRRASPSPPSKAGFARNLFGTTLNLSSCPGPELMAARARALRQKMLAQAEVSSTPQEEEETEERVPVQSSPFFAQEEAEATPPRPTKERRTTLQPVTRHPIATARSVLRDAEEVGNRNDAPDFSDEDAGQWGNATKKRRKEARKPERQNTAMTSTARNLECEDDRTPLDKSSEKSREAPQSDEPRQTEGKSQRREKRRRSPSPELLIIDDLDEVEVAPRQRKTASESHRERHRERKERAVRTEVPPATARTEKKQNEPKTTLRMRSRQKRGLLMLQQPSAPLPEPPGPTEDEVIDRVARTPSPEPSPPSEQRIRSASPEEVMIPSSLPPVEDESAPAEHAPPPAPLDSSSEDDLPQISKRCARKRRTYSPPPESDVGEESSKKKTQPRKATKRTVHGDKDGDEVNVPQPRKRSVTKRRACNEDAEPGQEEEEELQPRKRRAAKRKAYHEEPESEQEDEEEEEEPPQVQGPRITKLPRKGIRSREIIGYIPQGIESLIPGPFASASFRLGGPPVPAVSRETSDRSAKVDAAPTSASASSILPALAPALAAEEELVIEEKPVIKEIPVFEEISVVEEELSVDRKLAIEAIPVIEEELVVEEELIAEPSTAAKDPTTRLPEPLRPQIIAAASAATEATLPQLVRRRNVTVEAPLPVVRSNSLNNAIAATTSEPNATKLEALSAPEIVLTEIPEKSDTQPRNSGASCETEKKPDISEEKLTMVLPTAENTCSAGETSQAGRPRIANPASRGKKAARREDAAGLAPQVIVPFEPVQPVTRVMIRPGGGVGGGRGRIAAVGPLALGPVVPPPPAPPSAAVVAKKAVGALPGFTSASGGTWSRHAYDLLGMNRPERGR